MKLHKYFLLQLFFVGMICSSVTSKSFAQIDNSLIGEWHGIVEQVNFGSYETEMKIDSLVMNKTSGQIEYPSLSCGGENVLLNNIDSLHVFSETITFGGNCVDGRIELFKLSNDTIQWNWYYPNSTNVNVFGKLTRQDVTTNIQKVDFEIEPIIFPNPSDGDFTISLNDFSKNILVQVFNIQGQRILEKKISGNKAWINNLPKGFFIIKLFNEKNVYTQKIIVE